MPFSIVTLLLLTIYRCTRFNLAPFINIFPSLNKKGYNSSYKGGDIMQMIPVASSNLAAVGYDQDIMVVSFRNGTAYEYSSVPKSVYEGLLSASSKGQYLHSFVKGRYSYRKIR